MSFSVQRSVVESFKLNGKNIRAVHVPYLGECLVGLMCQERLGMSMTIMAGGQSKGMYPKIYDAA